MSTAVETALAPVTFTQGAIKELNKLKDQHIQPGDKIIFASMGAGMNINAMLYQF